MAASAACTSRIDWATNSSGGSTGGGGAASNSEVGASSISSNTASTDDGSGNGCGYRTEAQYAIRDEAPRSLPKRASSHCCLRSASRTLLPLPWTYTIVMPMLASPNTTHDVLVGQPHNLARHGERTSIGRLHHATRHNAAAPRSSGSSARRSESTVSKVTLKSARTPAYRAITARRGNVLASLVLPRQASIQRRR